MMTNEYVIKVPKTPPKEQLEHWQDYHILVEEETQPNGMAHYEVLWDAEDELFYILGLGLSCETSILYEDVKGCLSMNDIEYELEEESDDNESKDTVEGEDDSLSEYQKGYNQGYIDALANISEVVNKLKRGNSIWMIMISM